jgi:hypothetical protein
MFRSAVTFPVIDPVTGMDVLKAVRGAVESEKPMMLIERKSRY